MQDKSLQPADKARPLLCNMELVARTVGNLAINYVFSVAPPSCCPLFESVSCLLTGCLCNSRMGARRYSGHTSKRKMCAGHKCRETDVWENDGNTDVGGGGIETIMGTQMWGKL